VRVQGGGALHLLALGLDPHRFVAGNHALAEYRCDIGVDPVMITVLATVLDDAHPALAVLEVGPHMAEHRFGHVRMAHDVVRAANQLFAAETADRNELVIAVSDLAMGIGGGNKPLFGRKHPLTLSHREIVFHLKNLAGSLVIARHDQTATGASCDYPKTSSAYLQNFPEPDEQSTTTTAQRPTESSLDSTFNRAIASREITSLATELDSALLTWINT
jgi:hypothetical protein